MPPSNQTKRPCRHAIHPICACHLNNNCRDVLTTCMIIRKPKFNISYLEAVGLRASAEASSTDTLDGKEHECGDLLARCAGAGGYILHLLQDFRDGRSCWSPVHEHHRARGGARRVPPISGRGDLGGDEHTSATPCRTDERLAATTSTTPQSFGKPIKIEICSQTHLGILAPHCSWFSATNCRSTHTAD